MDIKENIVRVRKILKTEHSKRTFKCRLVRLDRTRSIQSAFLEQSSSPPVTEEVFFFFNSFLNNILNKKTDIVKIIKYYNF